MMLLPGVAVLCEGVRYELVEVLDLNQVVLVDAGGTKKTVSATEVSLLVDGARKRKGDIASIDAEALRNSWEAYRLICILMKMDPNKRSTEDIDKVATLVGKSRATVYRWIDRFKQAGSISSLLRKQRSDFGATRLVTEVEAVIQSEIEGYYLTEQRPSVASLAERVKKTCKEQSLAPPDESTVRERVNRLDPAMVEERRYGKKKAQEKYSPLMGSFPNADFPLAVVQIDHTPMDVIVVDDVWRKPINRPYLTLALDVKTKMVVGFTISLDHPGTLSTGLCIAHAILRKEKFLAELGLAHLSWPCYGKMRTIHTDNAKEFLGTMLGWAAAEHGIIAERRPKGQPRYGGNIERSFRTFMAKVHEEIPGTTFSNVKDKVEYNSDGKAVMTLGALVTSHDRLDSATRAIQG